ncbi:MULTISPECIES: SMP-30/gluconolactonase/LRE family protein [Paenibacillus]|uniref:SMP-30/gluconolactonase/LRE family protein n=1 Tax=Paenibacillus TaxID=44249 RepID=UPI0022B90073|nr:SMP-30/gluconolactonase/LRE family protein [Paenibacillus caseinilyticus]MCZ8522875.1 SMP-30/gluconolactonase/LRE family protein [Paenibacillus caseinilyticus]
MQETQAKAELVWDARAALGEGPVWDHRSGSLVWVDIEDRRVHFYDPSPAEEHRTIQLEQRVGAAVPRTAGGFVLAMQHGFYLMDSETGELEKLADPEEELAGNRFNDGKCDEAGRFWAGTMNMRGSEPTASLYCLEADGRLRSVLAGVTTSNGLGWSPDNKTMYYIDTPTKRVAAFDYDLASGELTGRRIVVSYEGEKGSPDGMTVDSEGMLWIAEWGGWQVSRWNPATGERIGAVPVPAAQVTSCAFGGEAYDELYITTARNWLSAEQLAEQPLAGGLFRARTGVKGRAASFYGG